MRPFESLGATETPDGRVLSLHHRDGDFFLYLDGEELMSSRAPGSEIALAELALAELGLERRHRSARPPRILIGGLGLGYTLRAALALLPRRSEVVVAELLPEVVEWNRRALRPLGRPLEDDRVRVVVGDVGEVMAAPGGRPFDAILMDVDNGPSAWCLEANERLYGRRGLGRVESSLAPGGVLSVWSAYRDPGFVEALRRAGFTARQVPVRARPGRDGAPGKGARHWVFVARRKS